MDLIIANRDGVATGKIYNNDEPSPLDPPSGQDRQNMMDQLGIKTLRQAAEGMNRQATNYQNTDESKANPYPNLPDVLTLKNGKKVTTPEMWWNQRRPEIVEDLEREVYGRIPLDTPKVTWTVVVTDREFVGRVPVIAKQLVGHPRVRRAPTGTSA